MTSAAHGFAAEIAQVIRDHFDPTKGPGPEGGVEVLQVASSEDNFVTVIYRRQEVEFTVGLRIRVFPDKDDEAARVVAGAIQEPLGSSIDTIEFDAEGIGWWEGDPPEWWYE